MTGEDGEDARRASAPAAELREFHDPRLVALYDVLCPFGPDSEFFCAQAARLGARRIIDLGCGTGILTCELAKRGHEVIGIDPSQPMLAVARTKPHAEKVRWMQGSFEQMDGLRADMVLMTSHVAQFFLDEGEWRAMLRAAHDALAPGGRLVFDVRRLTSPPFAGWPRAHDRRIVEDSPAGGFEFWLELISSETTRVRYELHYRFSRSGEHVVSLNELAFRTEEDITQALSDAGFGLETVYGNWDARAVTPDSPEMIFIAKREV